MKAQVRGWTLVEVIVVLVILAVLIAMALPSFLGVIRQTRLAVATHELMSMIALARSEAISRNSRTVLCVATGQAGCALDGGWHQGWLLFEDINSNGALDVTEQIIRYQSASHPQLVIKGNLPVARYISFLGNGRSHLLSGAMQAGTISICHRASSPVEGRAIVMNVVGRPRVKTWTPATASCE